jgi:hypothetical protein
LDLLLPISSALALAGVVAVAFSAAVASRRIRAVDERLGRSDRSLAYRIQLWETLLPVFVAARASLLPCPSCQLGADEPCVCDMRHRSLAEALNAVDQFTAGNGGREDEPRSF